MNEKNDNLIQFPPPDAQERPYFTVVVQFEELWPRDGSVLKLR